MPIRNSNPLPARTLTRRKRRIRQVTSFLSVFILIVIFPIFPASGEYLYSKTGGTFHDTIDRSTILAQDVELALDDIMIDVSDSGFVDINIAIDDDRDWGDRSDIISYTVQSGDTIGGLAGDFGLDINTIRWNNGLSGSNLRAGKKLTILPIDGLLHTVARGESISTLARLYHIETSAIREANDLEENEGVQVGQRVVLPGAKPIVVPGAWPGENARCYPSSRGGTRCSVDGSYEPRVIDPSGNRFVWGHCTYYVAQRMRVGWRGHARYWFNNAKKAGYRTGQIARPGSIIVWYGPGYNLAYGHVGIVVRVSGETMIVKDMNYAGLNVITTRKESIHNRYIIGYIYP